MRMARIIRFTMLDAVLVATNLLAFAALCTLMLLCGPTVPAILLAIGAGGIAAGKIGAAVARRERDDSP